MTWIAPYRTAGGLRVPSPTTGPPRESTGEQTCSDGQLQHSCNPCNASWQGRRLADLCRSGLLAHCQAVKTILLTCSIVYDMNLVSESYEWFNMAKARRDEYRILDERINIIEHAPATKQPNQYTYKALDPKAPPRKPGASCSLLPPCLDAGHRASRLNP